MRDEYGIGLLSAGGSRDVFAAGGKQILRILSKLIDSINQIGVTIFFQKKWRIFSRCRVVFENLLE